MLDPVNAQYEKLSPAALQVEFGAERRPAILL